MSPELFDSSDRFYGRPQLSRRKDEALETQQESLRRPLTSSTAVENAGQLSFNDEYKIVGTLAVSRDVAFGPQQ